MMKVEFQPAVSFKASSISNGQPRKNLDEKDTFQNEENIAAEIKEKPKKSFKEKTKSLIANVWKFFSVTGTMSYAAAKGVVYGAGVGAATILGAIALRSPKFVKEEGFGAIFKHPFKAAGKKGVVISAIGSLATLSVLLIKGKLSANQKSSVIEHKMDVAHTND